MLSLFFVYMSDLHILKAVSVQIFDCSNDNDDFPIPPVNIKMPECKKKIEQNTQGNKMVVKLLI